MKERIHLFCLERKTTRERKCTVLKISGFVWTGPKLFLVISLCQQLPFPLCVTVGITLLPLEFSREKVP